ncbi:hypothetical protein Drorol1_Dr00011655 [Drosera rotundifolia]
MRILFVIWFYKNWYKSKKKAFTKYAEKFKSEEGKKDIQAQLEKLKKYSAIIRVLAHTQVKKIKGLKQKKAHIMEIQVNGGTIAEKDITPVTKRYKVMAHCVETDGYAMLGFLPRPWGRRMSVPEGIVGCGMSGVCLCVDRVLYWTGSASVIEFDVGTEKFELTGYLLGVEFVGCVGLAHQQQ